MIFILLLISSILVNTFNLIDLQYLRSDCHPSWNCSSETAASKPADRPFWPAHVSAVWSTVLITTRQRVHATHPTFFVGLKTGWKNKKQQKKQKMNGTGKRGQRYGKCMSEAYILSATQTNSNKNRGWIIHLEAHVGGPGPTLVHRIF